MEQANMTFSASGIVERACERYGWMILSTSAILGIVAAVLTTTPSLYMFPSFHLQSTYLILGALGTALNIVALVMVLIPYRRYERWA